MLTKKSARPSLNIRAWSMLLVATLMDVSAYRRSLVLGQFPIFSLAYISSLRMYLQSPQTMAESAMTDINYAYISIKLWLMLAHSQLTSDVYGNITVYIVWNELWPALENIVDALEANKRISSVTVRFILLVRAFSYSHRSRLFPRQFGRQLLIYSYLFAN